MNQQVVYQDISQIHPYENNPRNNEAAVGPVAQSIKEFGFRVPILIDGKGTIIAGHTRYEAAKRLGMDKVPCIRVDDLTDAQIKAYRIADNKVAEASSWNDDVLRAVLVDKRWPVRGHIPGRGTGKFDDLQNRSRKGGVRGARRWLCKGPALFLWNNTTARADTGTENEEG